MTTENTTSLAPQASAKSPTAVLLLCIYTGTLGLHRFYVGKIFTGILMLITLGGLGIWSVIDLALILSNRFTDRKGNIIELAKNPIRFKKIMTIFSIFLVLIYGFFISMITTAIIATNTLTHIAQSQLDALRSHDIEKAYSYTSKEFQTATSLATFQEFTNQYQLETNTSASFNERNIKNSIANIKGTLKLNNGSSLNIEYNFKKEDGQWKILNMKVFYLYDEKNKPNISNPQAHRPTLYLIKYV